MKIERLQRTIRKHKYDPWAKKPAKNKTCPDCLNDDMAHIARLREGFYNCTLCNATYMVD